MRASILFAGIALFTAVDGAGAAQPKRQTCLDLSKAHSQVRVSGVLTVQLFPGPPNYESIARGDAEERAFILELPQRMCANDGEFIGPGTMFDRVHVSTSDEAMLGVFKASVGRTVTLRGEAFGAHAGHHHAPLVLMADQVTVGSEGR